VARDYINQPYVQLGESRIGPDLANFGARPLSVDPDRLTRYFYDQHGGMPAYRFLFEVRKVTGERSAKALNVPTSSGMEVVPTRRAQALVAYLQSLNNTYEYPEAKPVAPQPKEGEHAAAQGSETAAAKGDQPKSSSNQSQPTAPQPKEPKPADKEGNH
jgi:cytochrome c oxidase cbb3-type subunit 2